MRQRVYEALTNPKPSDSVGRAVSFALLGLIALNVAASILETDAAIAARAPGLFRAFEQLSVVTFTLEYVLRLWSCTVDSRFSGPISGRAKQALRPMMLIDLAAIAPFYLELLLPGVLDLRFLRALRLVRIFRLLNVGPLASAFARLVRVVQAKRIELAVSMAVVGVAVILAAGALYLAEHQVPGTPFTSIPRAMWWSVCTITTVGYGDIVPQTALGQFISGVVSFTGICAIALPVGIISTGYIDDLSTTKRAPTTACPHCGGELHAE